VKETIVAINAGSSSIKFCVYDIDINSSSLNLLVKGIFSGIGTAPHIEVELPANDIKNGGEVVISTDAIADLKDQKFVDHGTALSILCTWTKSGLIGTTVRVISHRVVHGGDEFTEPTIIDSEAIRKLEKLVSLAPLHQPHCIRAIQALMKDFPNALHVACFDTAFHRTMPDIAQTFALPAWVTAAGVKPYGFHGLSYEYIASQLPEKISQITGSKVVVAHLGHGASMCAMVDSRSIATTMSFTPLDGLPMATRSGAIDAGVVFYLNRQLDLSIDAISRLLNEESGLLGLSGISSDIRQLLASKAPAAKFALSYFVYRICRELGSLTAALGGLDALVFTGGVGARSDAIRALVCQQSAWLGIDINKQANIDHELEISSPGSKISVWQMATNEEQLLAQHGLEKWQSSVASAQPN